MSYQQFASYYDGLMADMPYPEWIRFALECWTRRGKRPETVVDLGCGTGGTAIPLAERGFRVTGIDLSADMLAMARQKSEPFAGAGSLQWLQQDMRDWGLPEQVDAVISFCDCLNYLTEEEDVLRGFQRTFAGLKPGGVFLFDVLTERQLRAYADSQPFVLDEDDISYIWTCEYEAERREITHELTFFARQPEQRDMYRRFRETHIERAYSLAWLEQGLLTAGFAAVAVYGDFTWHAPSAKTERAFFVAEKN